MGHIETEDEIERARRGGPYGRGHHLPTDPAARKAMPVFSGVLNYFPKAIAAISVCSKAGNDQHNPGKPLHWDRSKSGDELDALSRHLLEVGLYDTDGILNDVKLAWRALAHLEKLLEKGKSIKINI